MEELNLLKLGQTPPETAILQQLHRLPWNISIPLGDYYTLQIRYGHSTGSNTKNGCYILRCLCSLIPTRALGGMLGLPNHRKLETWRRFGYFLFARYFSKNTEKMWFIRL